MTNKSLVATGHGYADCRAFAGFNILAAPLPGYSADEREARVFRRASGVGTDYSSHVIALAVQDDSASYEGGGRLFLLVSHGGGREVWSVPSFYDGGEYQRALVAMPERLQYAALYTLYKMASNARHEGLETTKREYTQAFVEGRLKKSRPKQGRVFVNIEPKPLAAVCSE